MLQNKSGSELVIKYNGYEKFLSHGEKVDVRDFDISAGQTSPMKDLVVKVENKLVRKYAGMLEVVADDNSFKVADDAAVEIAALKKQVSQLEKEVEANKKIAEMSSKKNATMAGEINEFGGKEAGYKAEIEKLKKELKSTEEDNQAHISRIMGGKKG